MKNGKTNTTASGTETITKKRIFYPGTYYIVDKDNKIFKATKNPKELEDWDFLDTDTILVGIHPNVMFKDKKKKVTKIILDFEKKEMTLEGAGATIAKVEYTEPATYTLDDEDLKEWEDMIKDCKKATANFIMISTPPIKGELLDVE